MTLLRIAATALAALALAAPVQSQTPAYPSKPVRIIVPVAAGGIGDYYARSIGGQVQLTFATLPTVIPHVRGGKLRGVAVIGGSRSAAAPQIPTIAESGVPGFAVNNWIGLFAPAGTPPEIIRKVNAEVMRIMRLPEVARRMEVALINSHTRDGVRLAGTFDARQTGQAS